MAEPKYFDYEAAAKEAGISAEDLDALRRRIGSDYPSQMLREMHLHTRYARRSAPAGRPSQTP